MPLLLPHQLLPACTRASWQPSLHRKLPAWPCPSRSHITRPCAAAQAGPHNLEREGDGCGMEPAGHGAAGAGRALRPGRAEAAGNPPPAACAALPCGWQGRWMLGWRWCVPRRPARPSRTDARQAAPPRGAELLLLLRVAAAGSAGESAAVGEGQRERGLGRGIWSAQEAQ